MVKRKETEANLFKNEANNKPRFKETENKGYKVFWFDIGVASWAISHKDIQNKNIISQLKKFIKEVEDYEKTLRKSKSKSV